MRNIFLLYMPPNNVEAMTHYRDTIQQKVPFERIARFVSRDVAARLRRVFGERPIAVWGSRDGLGNRARFERMEEGDDRRALDVIDLFDQPETVDELGVDEQIEIRTNGDFTDPGSDLRNRLILHYKNAESRPFSRLAALFRG